MLKWTISMLHLWSPPGHSQSESSGHWLCKKGMIWLPAKTTESGISVLERWMVKSTIISSKKGKGSTVSHGTVSFTHRNASLSPCRWDLVSFLRVLTWKLAVMEGFKIVSYSQVLLWSSFCSLSVCFLGTGEASTPHLWDISPETSCFFMNTVFGLRFLGTQFHSSLPLRPSTSHKHSPGLEFLVSLLI